MQKPMRREVERDDGRREGGKETTMRGRDGQQVVVLLGVGIRVWLMKRKEGSVDGNW